MFGLLQPFIKNGGNAPSGEVEPVPLVNLGTGGIYWPIGSYTMFEGAGAGTTNLDLTNERFAWIGRVFMAGKASGAKTLSAAGGGKIQFRVGSSTWANAGSSLTVGLQDVDTTTGNPVRPDGSFDVSVTFTGGDGLLAANTWHTKTMTSGTKTLSHGDLVAIVFDMTARAGADVIQIGHTNAHQPLNRPMALFFNAASWGIQTQAPNGVLQFDDGTLAILDGAPGPLSTTDVTSDAWSDGSNPDERGLMFQVPFDCSADGLFVETLRADGATGDMEITLYGDPLGTPTVLQRFTVTAEELTSYTGSAQWFEPMADVALTRDTDYVIAIKVTGAGGIRLTRITLGHADHRVFWLGGTTLKRVTRNNGAGVFTPDGTLTVLYAMGVRINQVPEYVSP
jgi:hypothetical protein